MSRVVFSIAARSSDLTPFHMPYREHYDRQAVMVMQGRARINEQGRIVIPSECRAAAGLKPGDELIIETVGEGELRLRNKRSKRHKRL
jgi:AbrB family looped-hinge helix DNA binding protein